MQKSTLFCLLISLIFCANIKAQTSSSLFDSPKHEVRAVWLTTIGGLDWPHHYAQSAHSAEIQQQELCSLLDQYQKAGINTVLIQTRVRIHCRAAASLVHLHRNQNDSLLKLIQLV